ncbi:MAG TPA: molybdopterin cofactor-binding domain-containing protein [Xanthobacteraceae bacterium]|nr:molybdopterin cofactor-binding domain-containing protein [Xanthobacteraceae bacterium]
MAATLTRRQFGQAASALVIAFALDPRPAAGQASLPGSLAKNRMLDGWLRINADGSATVFAGKVELGQGILTALQQIAAEELDLPLARVEMISGDTARTPDEEYTSGSQSIEYGGTAIRLACAQARALMLERAAKRFNVAAETLAVADGGISTGDGRGVGYGDLAGEIDLHREASAKVAPKPSPQHKIVGRPVPRRDIPAKVTGGAAYVQDIRLPGMAHGRVVRPPRYGAKLDGVDAAAAKAMPGVIAVVRDGSFLGVVAEREEQVIEARSALIASARWSGGTEMPDPARLHDYLMALPTQTSVISDPFNTTPGNVGRFIVQLKQGAVPAGAQVIEATYTKPYTAHASIGPSCAVAAVTDGKLTVWTHSQGVFPLKRDLVKALKLDADAVRCIHTEGSGCYGHNGADDVALDAALLARAAAGRPVRVQWMRDDEFAWEPYGSAMLMRAKAALDGGRIVDWSYEVWSNTHSTRPGQEPAANNNLLASWYLAEPGTPGPATNIPQPAGGGDRNAVPLYDFPSQRVVNRLITAMPVRVSALRTLGAYANVFAIESFMDELALAAGQDPVAFRLAHLKDPRARAVVETVARKAGWKPGEAGDGTRGRGVAFAKYKNLATYVAVVAEVEVDRSRGRIRVPRVLAAADAGQIINPDGLANQIEGGIIQSTSWTLHEAVRFDRAGITSRDWSNYPILTMPEVPKVEVALIDRPDDKPLGAGEASLGPTVAAIANAFAHATGKRLRDLPFNAERVMTALG